MSIYDLSFTDNNNNTINLKDFEGKDILIVNTASHCGYTKQYAELQDAQNDSLVIIGFPCNQFGNQEPGTDEDIKEFCTTNYGVTFPISTKVEVNGPNTHPIYKYCKDVTGRGDIGWNFEKFLISTDGSIKHYQSSDSVFDIVK
ncbi:MAG: glutathione peroxidase [Alphaproteobacteria bacterium]|nr:glutathione peroxidase [Alphaproteobacteria bacterium]